MPIDYTSGNLAASITDPICEESGSPVENVGTTGSTATVILRVMWVDRETILTDILGGFLTYPRFPSANLFAISGSSRPWEAKISKDGQAVNYEYALLTINYATLDSADPGGGNPMNYFSESLTPVAEFITLPVKDLFWDNGQADPLEAGAGPSKLIAGFDYSQTRYRLSSVPNATLTAIAKANSLNVVATTLGLTFTPEVLLYNGSTSTRSIDGSGNGLWTLQSSFAIRPTGWNKFWRKDAWVSIYDEAGAVVKPIELVDLNGLIV